MNRESSRSHSIFTVIVEGSHFNEDGSQHITVGKLNLVDLAGLYLIKALKDSLKLELQEIDLKKLFQLTNH